MATLKVYSQTGVPSGEATLSDKLAQLKVNQHLIWEIIKAEQANARQGTHKAKSKGEVSGGGKKPWRQKGTGNARQGSIRAPQWRHGGIVFGPQPRSYHEDIPRRKKQIGLAHIFAAKVQQNKVAVYDGLQLEKPSTKTAFKVVSAIAEGAKLHDGAGKKLRASNNDGRPTVTIVYAPAEMQQLKSLRNIPWLRPLNSAQLKATELFYNSGLIVSRAALAEIDKKYSALL